MALGSNGAEKYDTVAAAEAISQFTGYLRSLALTMHLGQVRALAVKGQVKEAAALLTVVSTHPDNEKELVALRDLLNGVLPGS